jgi:hypothetical protein
MDTKQYAISREMYKKIKGMNREQLQVFATTIYLDGVKSVETTTIDLDRLREDIGAIKGIGESRLNEIMAVIEKYRS